MADKDALQKKASKASKDSAGTPGKPQKASTQPKGEKQATGGKSTHK